MIIRHNESATHMYNMWNKNVDLAGESAEKLSSGRRINRAADDAAGLAITQRMIRQIGGLEQAQRNIFDGIGLLQTAEGGLGVVHDALARMRDLANQAATDTLTDADRGRIAKEFEQLKNDINAISEGTEFNSKKVLRPPVFRGTPINGSADIVFVVDNTGSMSSIQTQVGSNIGTFINSIAGQGVTDIRMGVVEFKDFLLDNKTFGGDMWTTNAGDVVSALNVLASTNSGGTENTMDALIQTANNYSFRPNGAGMQNRHIILITNEDANDGYQYAAAQTALQAQGIQLHAVYDPSSNWNYPALDEVDALVQATGGRSVSITSSGWGSSLSSLIGNAIGNGASSSSAMETITLQVGADAGETFAFTLFDSRTGKLGLHASSILTRSSSSATLTALDQAIDKISDERANYGALQNRLSHILSNAQTMQLNLTEAESRIEDTDIAKEMMKQMAHQVAAQSAQAMLAQANQHPQSILRLLAAR